MTRYQLHTLVGFLLFVLTIGSISFVFFTSNTKGRPYTQLAKSTIKTVQVCTGTGQDRVCHTEERLIEAEVQTGVSTQETGDSQDEGQSSETTIVGSYEEMQVGSVEEIVLEENLAIDQNAQTDDLTTDEAQEEDESTLVENEIQELVVESQKDSVYDKVKEKVIDVVCNGSGQSKWCATDDQTVEDVNHEPTFISDPVASSSYRGEEGFYDGVIDHLIAGGEASIFIHGEIEDLDGQMDISEVSASLFMGGKTAACMMNPHDCYRKEPCTITHSMDANRIEYDCEFELAYWMSPTDEFAHIDNRGKKWYLSLTAKDQSGAQTYNTQRNFEVATITGLQLFDNIDFGTLIVGEFTDVTTNFDQKITQSGNVAQDLVVVMEEEEFTCSGSEKGIPRENLEWAIVDVAYGDIQSISMSDGITEIDINISEQIDPTQEAPTTYIYWNLFVPEAVAGVCTATINIYAKNAYLD